MPYSGTFPWRSSARHRAISRTTPRLGNRDGRPLPRPSAGLRPSRACRWRTAPTRGAPWNIGCATNQPSAWRRGVRCSGLEVGHVPMRLGVPCQIGGASQGRCEGRRIDGGSPPALPHTGEGPVAAKATVRRLDAATPEWRLRSPSAFRSGSPSGFCRRRGCCRRRGRRRGRLAALDPEHLVLHVGAFRSRRVDREFHVEALLRVLEVRADFVAEVVLLLAVETSPAAAACDRRCQAGRRPRAT